MESQLAIKGTENTDLPGLMESQLAIKGTENTDLPGLMESQLAIKGTENTDLPGLMESQLAIKGTENTDLPGLMESQLAIKGTENTDLPGLMESQLAIKGTEDTLPGLMESQLAIKETENIDLPGLMESQLAIKGTEDTDLPGLMESQLAIKGTEDTLPGLMESQLAIKGIENTDLPGLMESQLAIKGTENTDLPGLMESQLAIKGTEDTLPGLMESQLAIKGTEDTDLPGLMESQLAIKGTEDTLPGLMESQIAIKGTENTDLPGLMESQLAIKGTENTDLPGLKSQLTIKGTEDTDLLSLIEFQPAIKGTENADKPSLVENFPTEVLLNILSCLNGKQLSICRRVCNRWKDIIDDICDEAFWKQKCEMDYKDVYESAFRKREEGLPCSSLYRTLSLWPRLSDTSETQLKFTTVSIADFLQPISQGPAGISGFQLLGHGVVAVNSGRRGIQYYDLKTLKPSKQREHIYGRYRSYYEDDKAIILIHLDDNLTVKPKDLPQKSMFTRQSADLVFYSVQKFVVANNIIYFRQGFYHVYACDLLNLNSGRRLVFQYETLIYGLGCTNGLLYAVTKSGSSVNIIAIDDSNPVRTHSVEITPDLMLDVHLRRIFLWDNLRANITPEWKKWFRLNPNKETHVVEAIKVYGDMIFVGIKGQLFHIYHVPYLKNKFDVFYADTKPMKWYKFGNYGRFNDIDVMEGEASHTVLVGMTEQIILLKFSYTFKT